MATIKDIARLSGVSVGAVSYVINNQPGRVSEANRARVLEAIRELNYRPRQSPRRDMLPASLTLGITSASIGHFGPTGYYGEVVQALLTATDGLGHNATVFATRLFREDPMLSIRTYCDGQCAGLIVVAPGVNNPLVEALQNRSFPYVILGDASHPGASYCDLDNTTSARLAVDQLLDRGHRRIAYRGGPGDLHSQSQRLEGYRQALAARDIPVDEHLVSPPIIGGDDAFLPWMDQLLSLPAGGRPTAILCFSDELAVRVLDIIKRRGLSVPGDISLIGFDDADAKRLDPPLASIRQPYEQLALTAMNLLIDKIHRPDAPPQHVLFPGEVVIRASLAPV